MSKKTDISQLIQKYIKGELDARAMHQLERQAQDDPFLRDALEGYETEGIDHDKNLKELASWLDNRIPKKERRIIPIRFIATAAAILIFLFAGLLWYLNQQPDKQQQVHTAAKLKLLPQIKQPAIDTMLTPAKKTEIATLANKPAHHVNSNNNIVSREAAAVPPPSSNEVTVSQPVGNSDAKVTEAETNEVKPDSAYLSSIAKYRNDKAKSLAFNADINNKPLTGIVKDESGAPLPGASVSVRGSDKTTVTDANGKFVLPDVSNFSTLNIAFIGYNQKQVTVNKRDSLVIAMQPNTSSLNEVVVVGYGTSKKESDQDINNNEYQAARPQNGWSNFKKYLKERAISPDGKTGVVKVTFIVNPNGSLSDLKIKKSLSADADNIALQLIRNGSRWLPNTDHTAETVTVRVRFEPKK